MAAILIPTILILVGVAAYRYFTTKRLTEEGKIIKRKGAFWKEEHLFSTATTYEAVREAIRRTSFSDCKAEVYPDCNGEKCMLFKSSDAWNAEVKYCGEQNGKSQFVFHFIVWQQENMYSMNIMLTSIEKIFLTLDPATTVETRHMQVTTKTKFF